MADNYHAYLVRLWRDDETSPWRIRAQSVQDGRAFLFGSVEELGLFLSGIAAPCQPVTELRTQRPAPKNQQ